MTRRTHIIIGAQTPKEHAMTRSTQCPPPQHRPRHDWTARTLTGWCLTVVAALLTAVPAQAASSSDTEAHWIGWSPIKITTSGFDFGGATFVAGAPTSYGWLGWYLEDGQLRPALYGHLHLDDVRDLCARMRVDYFVGDLLWHTEYGGQVCASDDTHHAWEVSLNSYRSSKTNKVTVSIEKLTAKKDWTLVGSDTQALTPMHDKILITQDGFDFGSESFALGVPTGSGEVIWTWEGAQVRPHLMGSLHINNAASACARMRIDYFTIDGTQIAEKFGGKVCAPDNRHHHWDVDLEPFSDNKLASIKVGLQTLGTDDVWRTIDTATSAYVKVYPSLCESKPTCLKSNDTKID